MSTNIKKATGPDDLPNWILRDLSCTIGPPICAIFNQSLRDCKLPTEWKQANVCYVTPIPKVHPPRSIQSDVRPISLTPTISKYLESFIGSYIRHPVNHKGQTGSKSVWCYQRIIYYSCLNRPATSSA